MHTLKVRGVELGAGLPKIIVPIMGHSRRAILRKAREAANLPVDLLEWRADYYDELTDEALLLETARQLRQQVSRLPILFTVHTREEGGVADLTPAQYAAVNLAVARGGFADLIDVSFALWDPREAVPAIHGANCLVVGSRHDYAATPPKEEMVAWMRSAQDAGADIVKLAVMPHSNQDVLALLSAAVEMHEKYADRPLLPISMGPKGVISRVACETIGSCMSFGAAGQASASGQIQAVELKTLLRFMHTVSGEETE